MLEKDCISIQNGFSLMVAMTKSITLALTAAMAEETSFLLNFYTSNLST